MKDTDYIKGKDPVFKMPPYEIKYWKIRVWARE